MMLIGAVIVFLFHFTSVQAIRHQRKVSQQEAIHVSSRQLMGKKKKKEDPRPVSDPSTEAPALSFDGETLTSVFGMYPGYMGNLVASGFATVRFNADGNFLFKLDVEGVPENCTKCGVHIHTGFTCDNATLVGPHYWNLETLGQGIANDPWYIYGYYNATDLGKSQTAFVGNSGNGYGLNIGRAAVLHDGNGTRIACGLLRESSTGRIRSLATTMGAYPGYGGALTPSGSVKVDFFNDDAFKFRFIMSGLQPNCTKCGVHIHTGTTCTNASLVGGHYWNNLAYGPVDPWTPSNGSFYDSDDFGNAGSSFYLDSGYDVTNNDKHAVVFHAQNGTRISCGTLYTII